MDLTPLVDLLRRDLSAAAAVGSPEVQHAAELLAGSLEAAARLCLLEALVAAAAEVTAALPGGSVEVRLRGRDPELVVQAPAEPAPVTPTTVDTDEGTARVSLRLPETLKSRVEALATVDGVSLNTWLVRAVAAVARDSSHGTTSSTGRRDSGRRTGTHLTGWARS